MKTNKRQLRRGVWHLVVAAVLGIAALLVWKLVYTDVSEASMESRGVMLIRWHPDEEPKLQLGGNVSFVETFRRQGAEPLAIMEVTYWRNPTTSRALAWLGVSHDTTSSDLWFDDTHSPDHAKFEADARVMLETSPWMITGIHRDLLLHDGDNQSLRIIFFRRVPGLVLSIAAACFLLSSARNLGAAILRRRRARSGLCQDCGYPLAGGLCPECGH